MKIFKERLPEEVFTPRRQDVNEQMYVPRAMHERSLENAVRTGHNIIIFGDSGCGKSWLYKHTFAKIRAHHCVLDFTSATTIDEIDLIILEMIERNIEWVTEKRVNRVEGGAMPGGVGAKQVREDECRPREQSAFEQLCNSMRSIEPKQRRIVVFENLEHVLQNAETVAYIQRLILTLDDPNIPRTQICLVGVPSDIMSIVASENRYQTIANRTTEIPEIGRMSKAEAEYLIQRGFINELGYDIENTQFCVSQIIHVTDRIPQYLHDICLHASFIAEEFFQRITPDVIDDAIYNWIEANARQARESVLRVLGPGKEKVDQKTRTIFALGECRSKIFYADDIAQILAEEFPDTYDGKSIRVTRTLNDLSKDASRILKKSEFDNTYQINTPKIRAVIRHTLKKIDGSERIVVTNKSDD